MNAPAKSLPVLALLLTANLAVMAPARAFEAQDILAGLESEWRGQFQWQGDELVQYLSVDLDPPYLGEDGMVFVDGEAEYDVDGDVTVVAVEWQITPETGRIEIFDYPGKDIDPEDFISDGSYVGYLSRDLLRIKAIWTTISDGDQGTLVLEASGF